jgi:hypothetical protein
MIEDLIRDELIKRKVSNLDTLMADVLDNIELDISKYVEIAIRDQYKNKGMLKEGWLVKFDSGDNLYRVDLVNSSRARVVNMSDSNDVRNISPTSHISVLYKPEDSETLNENNSD